MKVNGIFFLVHSIWEPWLMRGVVSVLTPHLQQPKISVLIRVLKPPMPPRTNGNCSRVLAFSLCFAYGIKALPFLSNEFSDMFKRMFQFFLSHQTYWERKQTGHSHYLGWQQSIQYKKEKVKWNVQRLWVRWTSPRVPDSQQGLS